MPRPATPRLGFVLPSPTFDEDEVDAILLGLCLVTRRNDPTLEEAASEALAKIAAALPMETMDAAARDDPLAAPHRAAISYAIRNEEKLRLRYVDKQGVSTSRTIWPVTVDDFEAARVLAAWCETRRDFRHFRLDRIVAATGSGERYPKRRRVLLAEWRATHDDD